MSEKTTFPAEADLPPDPGKPTRRAIDLEVWKSYAARIPGGIDWIQANEKFGGEMVIRVALRLYDYDGLAGLIRAGVLKKQNMTYLTECLAQMSINADIGNSIEKYEQLKALIEKT